MSVQPVHHIASFATQVVALDAVARGTLFRTLDGARRYHGSLHVCAWHAHADHGLEARRLAYLGRLLKLQDVPLVRRQELSCPSVSAPARGAVDFELEIWRWH